MIPIKYIGIDQEHKENLYGTGIWFKKNETKLFDSSIAEKLLKHPDVYVLDEIKSELKLKKLEVVELPIVDEEDQRVDEMVQEKKTISMKTERQLKAYASTKFQHEFPEGTKIADMKQYLYAKVNMGFK